MPSVPSTVPSCLQRKCVIALLYDRPTGYQSTRHTVISLHGHVVTRSTRHTCVLSHSQLVTSEHIRKPSSSNFLSARRSGSTMIKVLNTDGVITASEHTTRHTQCRAVRISLLGLGLMCVISKPLMTAKFLNATNARSKSTVNSSQHRQTRRSTRQTILRCDELTGSPPES